MTGLLFAAGLLGLGCVCCGRAVAALMYQSSLARAGMPTRRPADDRRRSLDRARLARLSPIVCAIGGWTVASVPGALAGIVVGLAVTRLQSRRRAAARVDLLEDQLADAVSSLAAGLRAGLSLPRAIAFAADESDEPLGASLGAVADRTDLGVPLEAALEEWAAQTGSADARLLAGVLDLHRRTGGELPGVLDGVAATLRERRAAAREVRALTAQARLSGAILGLLPIAFFLFLSVTSRDDMAAAFRSSAGIAAIALGLTMQALAFVWIRSLLRVEA